MICIGCSITSPCKVMPTMNDSLARPFSQEEVKTALFQMFSTKAFGPHSFPACFFGGIGISMEKR
jgi:hypothetical protein